MRRVHDSHRSRRNCHVFEPPELSRHRQSLIYSGREVKSSVEFE
jgi:hypothetical protein